MKSKKKNTDYKDIDISEDQLSEILNAIDRKTLSEVFSGVVLSTDAKITAKYSFHSCCSNSYCYCNPPSVVLRITREIK